MERDGGSGGEKRNCTYYYLLVHLGQRIFFCSSAHTHKGGLDTGHRQAIRIFRLASSSNLGNAMYAAFERT